MVRACLQHSGGRRAVGPHRRDLRRGDRLAQRGNQSAANPAALCVKNQNVQSWNLPNRQRRRYPGGRYWSASAMWTV